MNYFFYFMEKIDIKISGDNNINNNVFSSIR